MKKTPRASRWRTFVAALAACVVALAARGCDKPPAASSQPAGTRYVMALASPGIEEFFASEEFVRARLADEIKLEFTYGGAHELALEVNAGSPVDLLVVADRTALDSLRTPVRDARDWLRDGLVVITSAHGGADDDELLRGSGEVAVADQTTAVGEYTRLALRMAGLHAVVEDRTRQHVDLAGVLEAVANGTCPTGIVYSTDAARARERVRVIGRLPLPKGVDLVYTLAPLNDEGRRAAAWLEGASVCEAARHQGYDVVGPLVGAEKGAAKPKGSSETRAN